MQNLAQEITCATGGLLYAWEGHRHRHCTNVLAYTSMPHRFAHAASKVKGLKLSVADVCTF